MPAFPGRAPGRRAARRSMIPSDGREGETVIQLGELVMILDLHRQGLSVSAIARACGIDRKTIRKYIERGLDAPSYGPRQPRPTGRRLFRELKEFGYAGGYSAVTDFLRDVRPAAEPGFEVRFETPPGDQG